MKQSIKIWALAVFGVVALAFNTSCTPTEAAIVGGLAGAAIGAAVADDHRGHGHYGPRGYGHRGPGPGPGYCPPPRRPGWY